MSGVRARQRGPPGTGRRVTICIVHESGQFYTYADDVQSVLNSIEQDAILEVWWVTANGQRFKEDMWFNREMLVAVRTERDDG